VPSDLLAELLADLAAVDAINLLLGDGADTPTAVNG
jgi:hypothetical protein